MVVGAHHDAPAKRLPLRGRLSDGMNVSKYFSYFLVPRREQSPKASRSVTTMLAPVGVSKK